VKVFFALLTLFLTVIIACRTELYYSHGYILYSFVSVVDFFLIFYLYFFKSSRKNNTDIFIFSLLFYLLYDVCFSFIPGTYASAWCLSSIFIKNFKKNNPRKISIKHSFMCSFVFFLTIFATNYLIQHLINLKLLSYQLIISLLLVITVNFFSKKNNNSTAMY